MNLLHTESDLIGIVTVLFNSDDVLPGFFESLSCQQGIHFRVYVIDNSSTPTGSILSRKLATEHSIDTRIVFNGHNFGVAKGNNIGIRMALQDGCSYILLANNDTEFNPTTIYRLSQCLANGAMAATSKIMYHSNPNVLWYAGGGINKYTLRTLHYGLDQDDVGQFDFPGFVGYAPTCFLLFSSSVFYYLGPLDEHYFVYYDDTDYVWRMTQAGIRISYVPDSVVYHKVSSSTGGGRSPFTVYYTNRNRIYFIKKNLNKWLQIFAVSYYLITRLIQLSLLPPSLSKCLIKGVLDGFNLGASISKPTSILDWSLVAIPADTQY